MKELKCEKEKGKGLCPLCHVKRVKTKKGFSHFTFSLSPFTAHLHYPSPIFQALVPAPTGSHASNISAVRFVSRKGRGNARCVNQKQNNLFCFSEKIQFKKSLFGYFFSRKSNAFTLAEVLITLGIIGVVAAFTIPNLIENIHEKQYKAAAKEAYSKSAQAVQMMKLDVGDMNYYMQGHPWTFKPVFMTYFKIAKDCYWSSCVTESNSSDIYSTLAGYGGDTADMGNDGQFVTIDGMFFNIQQGSSSSAPLVIVVDVNGYEKGPNVFGRDTFAFQVLSNSLIPMGASNSYLPAKTYCQRTGTSHRQGLGCMSNVMQNIDYDY